MITRLPLVIDPVLSYSTYFGGTAGETAWAVAINTNDGSVYIAGQTFSKAFYTNGPAFSKQCVIRRIFKAALWLAMHLWPDSTISART